MTTIANALVALGVTEWVLNYNEEPTTEAEFLEGFTKVDENPLQVTWEQIAAKREELINAQGASTDELSKLRTLWNAGAVNASSSVDILPDSPGSSLGSSGNTETSPKKNRRFGSNFFENKNINEGSCYNIIT